MANSIKSANTGTGAQIINLDSNGTVVLPCASDVKVSRWVLHVVFGGATPGSFIPKLSVHGTGVDLSGDVVDCVYYKVSTGMTAIPAGTATSTSAEDIYHVLCDACQVSLAYTASTHPVAVYAVPVLG